MWATSGRIYSFSLHLSEDFVIRSGCVCGPPSDARVSRLVEGIIGYDSSPVEVSRQNKIVVLHPFYDCQSLWFNLWRTFNKKVMKKYHIGLIWIQDIVYLSTDCIEEQHLSLFSNCTFCKIICYKSVTFPALKLKYLLHFFPITFRRTLYCIALFTVITHNLHHPTLSSDSSGLKRLVFFSPLVLYAWLCICSKPSFLCFIL